MAELGMLILWQTDIQNLTHSKLVFFRRFCSECVMSSLPTGSQGQCAICSSPVTASQLYTFTPKQTRAVVALAPLLDTPSNTSPTTSANSEESGEVVRGVQMKSKLKALLADLAKVRKEHDGAKVSELYVCIVH